MPELFEALKNHSQTKSDTMLVKKAEIASSQVTSQLYPTINLFGTYDNYSSPTNMKPLPPNEIKPMLATGSTIAQPYSTNIYKAGANFSMPIFVKSLYTTATKAETLQKSAIAKKRINLLKNEAIIVGSNANLLYLEKLQAALHAKKTSLQERQKTVQIKVENGRLAASAMYKIDDAINQVDIAINSIDIESKKLISTIETLTNIKLNKAIIMQNILSIQRDELGSLKPLQEKIKASRLELKSQKEKLYPTLVAYGSYAYSYAKAYNNDEDVNEEYGNIALLLTIPLLNMNQYESIQKANIELQSDEVALEKLRDELSSQADMLQNSLPLLDNSIRLLKKSIENKQKLLAIAKVSYSSGRLTVEEYLRYEDEVVDAEAKLYQTQAQKWQTFMELAVIYAKNIEDIIR